MQEIIRLTIGILFLIIGIPLGSYLAKMTNEELKSGKKWFKLILVICFIGALISLFFKNDVLLFSFLFIAVVTNKSLKR